MDAGYLPALAALAGSATGGADHPRSGLRANTIRWISWLHLPMPRHESLGAAQKVGQLCFGIGT